MKYYLLLFITLHSIVQCKNQAKKHKKELVNKSFIKYAKGFDIVIDGNEKKLVLKRMFQTSNKQQTFILGNETNVIENKIKTPIQSIVLTSTNHVPILELLNTESSLIGFPNTQYISSKITRDRIKKGKIMELGIKQEINTEKLIDLKPDLVIGYSLYQNNKLYKYLKKINIPVILNSDWLEESPL
ncbi:MAG TPA: ABC transporter substrate-binding protein, partial [Tenacibaculum sp.]|nr:ABC transporter substrate-binding protein [Tenacibaculum sp.]